MVTSSMAGWRLLPIPDWRLLFLLPCPGLLLFLSCPAFRAITKSVSFICRLTHIELPKLLPSIIIIIIVIIVVVVIIIIVIVVIIIIIVVIIIVD
ncbi:hypothetical protein STEG23_003883 [Scotinomys teguina]